MQRKKESKIKRNIIRWALLILLIAGAAFAAYKIYAMTQEEQWGLDLYTQVQQQAAHSREEPSGPGDPDPEPEAQPGFPLVPEEYIPFPAIDFALLKEQNPDTVGWVTIEGTTVNYPVVQGTDNRHYVSTLFDGTVNKTGTIFMDFRNAPDMSDRHTILYGHNMKNATMFADLLLYQDQAYYEAHPVGMYLTPEKNYRFHIVAAYVTSLADSAWQLEFVTEEDLEYWLQDARDRSPFESPVQFQPGDRVITLSTCSYEYDDARFVLVGILEDPYGP